MSTLTETELTLETLLVGRDAFVYDSPARGWTAVVRGRTASAHWASREIALAATVVHLDCEGPPCEGCGAPLGAFARRWDRWCNAKCEADARGVGRDGS